MVEANWKESMKKIVIDARELRTSTGRYIERLLEHLQDVDNNLSHRYYVLLKPKDMDSWDPKSKRFTKVASPYKEFTFAEQIGLAIQLYRLKPDLVHFGMTQQPILYLRKAVTTIHDLTTVRFTNPAKNKLVFKVKQWVYERVIKIVAFKSQHLIVPTEFVKEDVAKFTRTNSRKITVTLEAGDSIGANPEKVAELEGKQFIMYVGRPTPHKNLGRLIDAFEILKQSRPDLVLVLAGRKDVLYRRHERTVKKRGIEDVVFTDFISDGQLRWLYEHTAAYVFPSLSEGFGLPGLEAMSHGAPVVSSDATCLPEVYGEAANYFNPLDATDMATKIADVLDKDDLRKTLIKKGKTQAGKYSWKRMAEQTLEVYKKTLGEQ
ncbi:MAG: glycosyl transferase family 1 [Candidatus Saccharibacteria bacterium]|nr:glycosyl transferase family 1 [Candidatus Saccharibacteria bacterium]